MYICAIEDRDYKEDKINCKFFFESFTLQSYFDFLHDFCTGWRNVYGFDMSYMRGHALAEPLVDAVDSRQISTNHTLLVVSYSFFTENSFFLSNDLMFHELTESI
jgi:type I protein arginine methyltransferase